MRRTADTAKERTTRGTAHTLLLCYGLLLEGQHLLLLLLRAHRVCALPQQHNTAHRCVREERARGETMSSITKSGTPSFNAAFELSMSAIFSEATVAARYAVPHGIVDDDVFTTSS